MAWDSMPIQPGLDHNGTEDEYGVLVSLDITVACPGMDHTCQQASIGAVALHNVI